MIIRKYFTAEEVAECLGHTNWNYVYTYEAIHSEVAYRGTITLVLSDEPLGIHGRRFLKTEETDG